jgi:hypothetical protein
MGIIGSLDASLDSYNLGIAAHLPHRHAARDREALRAFAQNCLGLLLSIVGTMSA